MSLSNSRSSQTQAFTAAFEGPCPDFLTRSFTYRPSEASKDAPVRQPKELVSYFRGHVFKIANNGDYGFAFFSEHPDDKIYFSRKTVEDSKCKMPVVGQVICGFIEKKGTNLAMSFVHSVENNRLAWQQASRPLKSTHADFEICDLDDGATCLLHRRTLQQCGFSFKTLPSKIEIQTLHVDSKLLAVSVRNPNQKRPLP